MSIKSKILYDFEAEHVIYCFQKFEAQYICHFEYFILNFLAFLYKNFADIKNRLTCLLGCDNIIFVL